VKLSWRVHLLPYLEQEDLYAKFRLDEPWDSPHNRKLILQMPEIYGEDPEGRTVFHVFTSPDGRLPFSPGKGTWYRHLGNEDHKTIGVVAAGTDKAEPWTKPGGLEFPTDATDLRTVLGDVGPHLPFTWLSGSTFSYPVDDKLLDRLKSLAPHTTSPTVETLRK
jgi:hypothetical protein